MIIDIHGHIGRLGERQFSAEALDSYLRACDVQRLLISNLDAAADAAAGAVDLEEPDANLACLEACRRDARLAPLYWARPGRMDSNLHAFAGALDTEPFTGVLFSPTLNDFDADDALLDPYLSIMAKFTAPAVFQTGRDARARPAKVYALAKRHQTVSIVLYDAAGDAHWSEAMDVMRRSIQRDDARLYVDTSHAAVGDIVAAVSVAGADRVLFGSDAAVHGLEHAEHTASLLKELDEALPSDQYTRLVGKNAAQVFRLSPPARNS